MSQKPAEVYKASEAHIKSTISRFNNGRVFDVNDIFPKFKSYDKTVRQNLGKMFKNRVRKGQFTGVSIYNETDSMEADKYIYHAPQQKQLQQPKNQPQRHVPQSPGLSTSHIIMGVVAIGAIILAFFLLRNCVSNVRDFFSPNTDPPSVCVEYPGTGINEPIIDTAEDTAETPEERRIREAREFRPVILGGPSLGYFIESIAPEGEWQLRFDTEVTFEGETELGWLSAFFWFVNDQMGAGVQLGGENISFDELVQRFQ